MFKKTFLAVAVGAALGSAGANAQEQAGPFFGYDINDWTNEGAELVTDFAVPNITIRLDKEYTPDDLITLQYDKVVDGVFPTTINVDDGLAPDASGAFTMTLGLLDQEDNSTGTEVRYRVTEITSTGSGEASAISTDGAYFVLGAAEGSDLTTDAAAVRSTGSMTLQYTAETQVGTLIELESGNSGNLFSFDEQFHTVTVDPEFDGVIDVERGIGEDYNNIGTDSQYFVSTGGGGLSGEDFASNVEDLGWDYENAPSRAIFTTGSGRDSATVNVAEIDFRHGNTATEMCEATDTMADFCPQVDDTTGTHDALATTLTLNVTGPFGFLVDEDDMTPGVQNDALIAYMPDARDGTREQVPTWSGNTATFVWDNDGSAEDAVMLGDIGLYFDNADNGAGDLVDVLDEGAIDMDRGMFMAEAVITYTPADEDYVAEDGSQTYTPTATDPMTSESADAGEWTMDGSTVTVYAVPFQPGVSVFLWITNQNMEEDTPVMITATDANGVVTNLGEVATLAPNGITRLSSDLNAALEAAGVATGRVTLEITTSAPACDVNVAASYKVQGDADRLPLETSQTINGVHNTGNSGLNNDLCVL